MGLLSKIMKGKSIEMVDSGVILAPITGNYIAQNEIPDPVFAEGLLGVGCGIEPGEGMLYSPVNGTVVSVVDTKHAIGIEMENGVELLIHVGMDTVSMNGKGFQLMVKENQKIKAGQLIMKFDIDEITRCGHPTVTAFVVVNDQECEAFDLNVSGPKKHGSELTRITKVK